METKIQRAMDQRRRLKYKIFSLVRIGEEEKKSYYRDKGRERYSIDE